MSNFELKEFLEAEQMENPMLEVRDVSAAEDLYAIGCWFSNNEGTDPYQQDNEQETQYDIPDRSGVTLADHLKGQIRYHELTEGELKLLYYIIDLLDADTGFLTAPVKEIAYLTDTRLETVAKCVKYLQSLEPAGVGAENLKKCLILQAERAGCADKTLIEMIKYYLQDIAEGKYRKISNELNISRQQIIEYVEIIKSFNPRPSRGFGDNTAEFIIPDVLISRSCGEWEIVLNDKWIGSINIDRLYKKYVKNAGDEKVREYLEEKINRAKFIIKCIEQRRETLLKISRFILERQLDYITGTGYLKTLSLAILPTASAYTAPPSAGR